MNFLNVFEERVSSLFNTTASDVSPISFKKLAKQATKELQNETYVIDSVNTAPALFTVLVNGGDNQQMAPVQADLAHETELFLEAAAKRKKYEFVGMPLVRFMVDPGLRPGKFSVFAENIDAPTLEKLRAEERGYLHAAAPSAPKNTPDRAPVAASQASARSASVQAKNRAGNVHTPETEDEGVVADHVQVPTNAHYGEEPISNAQQSTPRPATKSVPLAKPKQVGSAAAAGINVATRTTAGTPSNAANSANTAQATGARGASRKEAIPPEHVAMLIDRQTGQTFTCNTPECIIGRERSSGGIVLRDPNVSRNHAKLTFNGRYWAIEDLGSTNGTLVNNADTQKQRLSIGDVITLGLTNLEFMEG